MEKLNFLCNFTWFATEIIWTIYIVNGMSKKYKCILKNDLGYLSLP